MAKDTGLATFEQAVQDATGAAPDPEETPPAVVSPGAAPAAPASPRKGPGRPPGSKTKNRAASKEPEPPPAPIDPELVAGVLYTTLNLLASFFPGTPPVTQAECEEGGKAWAPIFDHYFPRMAGVVGIWGPPVLWSIGVTLPRVTAYLQAKAEREQLDPERGFRDGDAPAVDWDAAARAANPNGGRESGPRLET